MTDHIYPGAWYRPTAGVGSEPILDQVAGVIWHLSASEATSLFGYFNGRSGGIESHFHVARNPENRTEQYRPANREADANYRGNSWAVGRDRYGFLSIEFQGADPNSGQYTPWQIEEGLAITEWACQTYGFQRRVAPSYRSEGIGYHVMFGAGPNLNAWSNARGKVCPGAGRIQQFREVIVPRFLGGATPLIPADPIAPLVPVLPAPPFPLPIGSYFGPKEGPVRSVSGYYSHRNDLRRWQERMDQRGWRIVADGLYGPQTESVARQFQAMCGIAVDGLIGPDTWARAWEHPVT